MGSMMKHLKTAHGMTKTAAQRAAAALVAGKAVKN